MTEELSADGFNVRVAVHGGALKVAPDHSAECGLIERAKSPASEFDS